MKASHGSPLFVALAFKRVAKAIVLLALVSAFVSALTGCAFVQRAQQFADSSLRSTASRTAQMKSDSGQQISVQELDQLTYAFADRYLTYIVSACELIEKDNPNAEQRRLAHQVKLVQVSSIYDIVTNADPFTQLLDLTLVVTLQSQKWIDEDQADRWFGDRGQYLINASRKAREDIWRIAARTMKPEQLEVLDNLIWEWRQKNRDIQLVSYVRFDDFAATRGKSIVADVKTGTGLLAPVDEAKKAVDDVRLLAERAFYIGKRMPFLVNWQMRSAIDDTLSDPQVRELTGGLTKATNSMDRLPQDIARERAAIFAEFNRQQPFMNSMMTQVRGTVSEGNQLAMNVRSVAQSSDQLLQTVDRLFLTPSRMAPKRGDEKPFDITEYTKTLTELNIALKEANQLVGAGSALLASKQLDQLATKQVTAVTEKGEGVVNTAFWRGVALIITFFVMLTLYRAFTHWLAKSKRA
jgi:hypothetical protein